MTEHDLGLIMFGYALRIFVDLTFKLVSVFRSRRIKDANTIS